jgi:hypothetical protein
MALHLGKVKVGTGANRKGLLCVVVKVNREVEERSGNRDTVHKNMLLIKVPSSRPFF